MPPTDAIPTAKNVQHSFIPRTIRKLALPIIAGLDRRHRTAERHRAAARSGRAMRSVSMSPDDAPSVIAMKQVGAQFQEFKSNSSVMIVLEGQQPLGDEAHKFYDQMVKKLEADPKHVEHVQDFWSDPLTAAGSQSNDGKAAYVQVYLAGNQGESLANESVEAVQQHRRRPAPTGRHEGLRHRARARSPPTSIIAGDRSMQLIEMVTFSVIIVMLLLVYRSIVTVLLVLVMVVLELAAARGVVAFLGFHDIIGLSTFATNLLVTLAIAAATDYAIFLIGRYQEARGAGEDRETAYYTMYRGTAHVVLGSGLTIAGATFCLHFTNLPYFQSLGIPLAIGMVDLSSWLRSPWGLRSSPWPAVSACSNRSGRMRVRGWRKIGAAVVRWPGPILVGDDRPGAGRPADAARVPRPTTTTATTCPRTSPPTRATRRPIGTSRRPG